MTELIGYHKQDSGISRIRASERLLEKRDAIDKEEGDDQPLVLGSP